MGWAAFTLHWQHAFTLHWQYAFHIQYGAQHWCCNLWADKTPCLCLSGLSKSDKHSTQLPKYSQCMATANMTIVTLQGWDVLGEPYSPSHNRRLQHGCNSHQQQKPPRLQTPDML